jgi:hypothetical protein
MIKNKGMKRSEKKRDRREGKECRTNERICKKRDRREEESMNKSNED